jgi:hypothetical protein
MKFKKCTRIVPSAIILLSTVISKIVHAFKGPPNEPTHVTDQEGGCGIKTSIRPPDLPGYTTIKALLIQGKNTEGNLTIEMRRRNGRELWPPKWQAIINTFLTMPLSVPVSSSIKAVLRPTPTVTPINSD